MESIRHISVVSLFVEDVKTSKAFYERTFDVPTVFQDETSAVVKFENLLVNLLQRKSADEIVEPGRAAPPDVGSRFQLSIWVKDVDAVCSNLKERGVTLLTGPRDRPWGMRTANFVDPDGHSWEVAQRL